MRWKIVGLPLGKLVPSSKFVTSPKLTKEITLAKVGFALKNFKLLYLAFSRSLIPELRNNPAEYLITIPDNVNIAFVVIAEDAFAVGFVADVSFVVNVGCVVYFAFVVDFDFVDAAFAVIVEDAFSPQAL